MMTEVSRLRLSSTVGRSKLDGAWWPKTNDLTHELPFLIKGLPSSVGRVMRVVYSKAGWAETLRRVPVAPGVSVRVAPFGGVDNHRLLLQTSNGLVIQLMIVPPMTDLGAAELMMTTAASADNHASAAELLAATLERPATEALTAGTR